MAYVIIRTEPDGEIVKAGESFSLEDAKELLTEDYFEIGKLEKTGKLKKLAGTLDGSKDGEIKVCGTLGDKDAVLGNMGNGGDPFTGAYRWKIISTEVKKISIPLGNDRNLVASAEDYDIYKEIYITVEDDGEAPVQELALARQAYHYEDGEELAVPDAGKYEVLLATQDGDDYHDPVVWEEEKAE